MYFQHRILDAAETLVTLHHNSDTVGVKPSPKLVHIHKREIINDSYDSQAHLTITTPRHSLGMNKIGAFFGFEMN
jgi:hypothetical protein